MIFFRLKLCRIRTVFENRTRIQFLSKLEIQIRVKSSFRSKKPKLWTKHCKQNACKNVPSKVRTSMIFSLFLYQIINPKESKMCTVYIAKNGHSKCISVKNFLQFLSHACRHLVLKHHHLKRPFLWPYLYKPIYNPFLS